MQKLSPILIWILILMFFGCKKPTTYRLPLKYYISNNGSDAGSGQLGTDAWKTIGKLNSQFKNLVPGDSIFLERGGVWHERLNIAISGGAGKPIVISAYGSGQKPLISGFSEIEGWANKGSNIWESDRVDGTNNTISMVTINGVAVGMGRWPNANAANEGYRTYNVGTPGSSIVDDGLPASPNYTGATVCIRVITDILNRAPITNHSGKTINYTATTGSGYPGQNGLGYFVENALNTLDAQNEWYFDEDTRKLSMYSQNKPTGIRMGIIDTLVWVAAYDNITFDNLAFEGSNIANFSIGGPTVGNSSNITIQNCDMDNSGRDGIYATNDTKLTIRNNTINHSMNNGIILESEGGRSVDVNIQYNTIKNTGAIKGLQWVDYAKRYDIHMEAISNVSNPAAGEKGMTVKFNTIDTVGHVGVRFYQNNTNIDSNYINYTNFITDDGGAINTFGNFQNIVEENRTIVGNIIRNCVGAAAGGHGGNCKSIYLDDEGDGVIIKGNSVDGSATNGIYLHNAIEVVIEDNNVYNSEEAQLSVVNDAHAPTIPIRNVSVGNNIFIAKKDQLFLLVRTYQTNDIDSMFNTIDKNTYGRPDNVSGTTVKTTRQYQRPNNNPQAISENLTFSDWQSKYKNSWHGDYDKNSTQMVANDAKSTFYYNATSDAKTIDFAGYSKVDVFGTVYNNSINIPPWQSRVLFDKGGTPPEPPDPPTPGKLEANAGEDVVLESTATTTTLNTVIKGLRPGIYKYELEISDDKGVSARDTVNIKVGGSTENTPPTANAGPDVVLTLPTTETTLHGSGSDAEGPVTYEWTREGTEGVISTTADVHLAGLTGVGSRTYKLTVTDNKGLTAFDYATVTTKQ